MMALRRAALASSSRRPHHHHHQSFAAAAATRGSGDKSWGEIAEEAAVVAKDVAGKIGQGVGALAKALSSAVSGGGGDRAALTPERRAQEEQERRLRQQQKDAEQSLSKALGGGLFGRVASGVLSSAARSIASSLEAQQRETADVRAAAEAALKSSPDLSARLGGVEFEVGPTMSQSSSSMSVNGRTEKRVALVVPLVDGRSGRVLATARVDASPPASSSSGGRDDGAGTRVLDAIPVDVTVTLPTGETLKVGRGGGGRGGGGGGRTTATAGAGASSSRQPRGGGTTGEVIDAEFKEL